MCDAIAVQRRPPASSGIEGHSAALHFDGKESALRDNDGEVSLALKQATSAIAVYPVRRVDDEYRLYARYTAPMPAEVEVLDGLDFIVQ